MSGAAARVGYADLIVADIVLHRVALNTPLPMTYEVVQMVPDFDRPTGAPSTVIAAGKIQRLVFHRDDFSPPCDATLKTTGIIVERYVLYKIIDEVHT